MQAEELEAELRKFFAQHGANIAFTYSSSVESAMVLENELNALGIKAKGYKSNAAGFFVNPDRVQNPVRVEG